MTTAATTTTKPEEKVVPSSDSDDFTDAEDSKGPVQMTPGGPFRISSSRKRIIDEAMLSPEEADKLQTRRAYNRECATRARKRTKNLVAQLQDDVKSLQGDKEELRRENAVLKAKLEAFEKQNQNLMLKQAISDSHAATALGMATGNFLQPRITLGDALTDLRMASLASRDAVARTRLLFPTPQPNLLASRFPTGLP